MIRVADTGRSGGYIGSARPSKFENVGRILDLVRSGASQSESGKKMFPREFPPGFHAFPPLKVCGIVRYNDLLLPGNQLLAQLPVFGSGELGNDA